ncbi:MAG: hypothetical protein GF350_08905 [Chitinivibrionales bacterium]|nr:hypothetical protein [Chitinivibrionales bacterium]
MNAVSFIENRLRILLLLVCSYVISFVSAQSVDYSHGPFGNTDAIVDAHLLDFGWPYNHNTHTVTLDNGDVLMMWICLPDNDEEGGRNYLIVAGTRDIDAAWQNLLELDIGNDDEAA